MFREEIQKQATRARERLQAFPEIATSEAQTKNSLIEPFLRCLGYDPSHPQQVMLEVATELDGKIDYVLTGEANVKIAVEAKKAGISLSQKEANQLRSYFTFSEAVAAILTNGIDYWLFTDLDKTNVMDSESYHKINVTELNDRDIDHLEALTKHRVEQSAVREQAQREHYRTRVNEIVDQELDSPSQEFLRLVGKKAGITPLTKPHLELLRPLITEAISRNRRNGPPPPPPCPGPRPPGSPTDPWPSVYPGYDPGKPRIEARLKGVTLLGRRLLAKNHTHMLCLVVAVLQSQHPGDFAERVSKEPFFKETRTRQYISSSAKDFDPKYPKDRRKVGAYYVAVGLNADAKVRRARLFLSEFGHDPDELVIHTPD